MRLQLYKRIQRLQPLRFIFFTLEQFSVFSIFVDPPRLSEQAPSSQINVTPFASGTPSQIPELPSTNPPNVEILEVENLRALDNWGEIPEARNVDWVTTSAHGTSG